jgi:hypothetical protein
MEKALLSIVPLEWVSIDLSLEGLWPEVITDVARVKGLG